MGIGFFLGLIPFSNKGISLSCHNLLGITLRTHPQHVSKASVSKINLSPILGR